MITSNLGRLSRKSWNCTLCVCVRNVIPSSWRRLQYESEALKSRIRQATQSGMGIFRFLRLTSPRLVSRDIMAYLISFSNWTVNYFKLICVNGVNCVSSKFFFIKINTGIDTWIHTFTHSRKLSFQYVDSFICITDLSL